VSESGSPEIESLERSRRLVVRPKRSLWPVAALLVGTLLVVSTLLFARVGETEIELEIDATEVSFSLTRRDLILRDVMLERLGASGLSRIVLPHALAEDLPMAVTETEPAIQIVANTTSANGAVTIGALAPPWPTSVWLRRTGEREYRLSMRSPEHVMRVEVFGSVVVAVAGRGRRAVDLLVPDAIELATAGAPHVVDLDLEFRDHSPPTLMTQVPMHDLSFMRVDEFGDRDVALVRALSTIRFGTLYFESLNGVARTLRTGERLRFDRAEGEIRSLRLHDDHLSLAWHGRVSGMRTGSDANPRNLMPTWLEWLRARHGLSLLWGSTLYVFGLTLGVLRWLGRSE
jgi:hypothetical protein